MKNDYELLDCGDGRKLEKFGAVILDRPCPQASWKKENKDIWHNKNGIFFRNKGRDNAWYSKDDSMPAEWEIELDEIKVLIDPAPNGQVGIFPEQLQNWRLLKKTVADSQKDLKVLNGFSYTGIANLFALSAQTENQVEITHVDAAKSAVNKARKNVELNGFGEKPVRWIVDDIVSFMEKEKRREKTYDIIILDPPAFGRTKSGKRWELKKDLPRLLELAESILSYDPQLFMISCHDPETDIPELEKMINDLNLPGNGEIQSSELNLKTFSGKILHSGISVNWVIKK
jgi:23S rRNA (cytosine1962-C5)-methyltransferase